MSEINDLKLSDFDYALPDSRIAQYPLKQRDQSKLLVYKDGTIQHKIFNQLPELLDQEALLVFNNTKVFPARTFFQRETGAVIQIFILDPVDLDIQQAMSETENAVWECMIGNLKKWKDGETLSTSVKIDGVEVEVKATLEDRERRKVMFSWNNGFPFSKVIYQLGKIPLPPYIRREANDEDLLAYQTVYAKKDGAVAAPTAGLHFTPEVLNNLESKGVQQMEVTLHVSAGTFQPLQAENVVEHDMHSEAYSVSREGIKRLRNQNKRIAVGTTSLRTLESLYWAGVKASRNEDPQFIEKLYPYNSNSELSYSDSMNALLMHLEHNNLEEFQGRTEIMIMPGYKMRSIATGGLITNFHLPQSTLIMLISAFVGNEWRNIYKAALDNDYRFLSYGDSSLLLPSK